MSTLHTTLRWLLELAMSDAEQDDIDARIQFDVRSSGLTDAQVSMATSTLTHALHGYLNEATTNDGQQLRCSFCHKPRTELGALVTGPGVNICDQCIKVAGQCITQWQYTGQTRPSFLQRWSRRWFGSGGSGSGVSS